MALGEVRILQARKEMEASLTVLDSIHLRAGVPRRTEFQHARAVSDDDRGQHCDVEDQRRYDRPRTAIGEDTSMRTPCDSDAFYYIAPSIDQPSACNFEK